MRNLTLVLTLSRCLVTQSSSSYRVTTPTRLIGTGVGIALCPIRPVIADWWCGRIA